MKGVYIVNKYIDYDKYMHNLTLENRNGLKTLFNLFRFFSIHSCTTSSNTTYAKI